MVSRRNGKKIFLLAVLLFTASALVYESIHSVKNNTGAADMIYGFGTGRETDHETDSGDSVVEYTFTKVDDEEKIWGTFRLCAVYEYFEYEKIPLAYGQLLALFGEPLYVTENLENQYQYVISAADSEGNITYLSAYGGPSGPAIGGTEDGRKAAEALRRYICSAKAADYDYEGYYMDIPCRVEMGVKDGVPYSREEILELTDAEYIELSERVYGIDWYID